MAVHLEGVRRGRWVPKVCGLGVSQSGSSFIGNLSSPNLVTVQVAESPQVEALSKTPVPFPDLCSMQSVGYFHRLLCCGHCTAVPPSPFVCQKHFCAYSPRFLFRSLALLRPPASGL